MRRGRASWISPSRKRAAGGFTLLEVMVAMAILAIALGALFASEAGSVRMAVRARKLGFASMLVRCKMGEIEEQIAKEGFPALFGEGEDNCCKDAEIQGFTCKWEIEPVAMPDTMFNPEDGEDSENADADDKDKDKDKKSGADSKSADSKSTSTLKDALGSGDSKNGKKKLDPAELLKDPKKLLGGGSTPGAGLGMGAMGMGTGTGAGSEDESGGPPDVDSLTAMAMQYVYPILKPAFESQIRRATVTVKWNEGSAEQKFDVTQYLVAEQPIPIEGLDPNDPNAQNGTGTGTGTGSGTGTKPGTNSTGTGTKPNLFQPSTNFGAFGTTK